MAIVILNKISRMKEIEYLPQTLIFNRYIFAAQCRRSLRFQTVNHVRTNNLFLKYQRLSPSGCKDNGKLKSEFEKKNSISFQKEGCMYVYWIIIGIQLSDIWCLYLLLVLDIRIILL